jgi:hypothetical protein
MHGENELVSQVIFGWDPLWVSTILFIATYALIVSERINRAIVSGLGAALMVSLGVLSQEDGDCRHNPRQRGFPVCCGLVGEAG